jgi:hypothetical protein
MGNAYQIRLKETLDECWAKRFDDWAISHEDDGTTLLVGPVHDQAALHGLLDRVRDLGLTLLAVTCIGAAQEEPCRRTSEALTDDWRQ